MDITKVTAASKDVSYALKMQLLHISSFTLPNAVHVYVTDKAIYLQTRSSVICTTKIPALSSENFSEPFELVIKLKSTLEIVESMKGEVELLIGVSGVVISKGHLSVTFPPVDVKLVRYVCGEVTEKITETTDGLRDTLALCLGTKTIGKLLAKQIDMSVGKNLAQVRYPNVFFQFHSLSSLSIQSGEPMFQFLSRALPQGEKLVVEHRGEFVSIGTSALQIVLGEVQSDIVDLSSYISGSVKVAMVNMSEIIRVVVKLSKTLKKCDVMFSFPTPYSCRAEIRDDGCNVMVYAGKEGEATQNVRFTLPIEIASTILSSCTSPTLTLRKGDGHYIFTTENSLIIFTSV